MDVHPAETLRSHRSPSIVPFRPGGTPRGGTLRGGGATRGGGAPRCATAGTFDEEARRFAEELGLEEAPRGGGEDFPAMIG